MTHKPVLQFSLTRRTETETANPARLCWPHRGSASFQKRGPLGARPSVSSWVGVDVVSESRVDPEVWLRKDSTHPLDCLGFGEGVQGWAGRGDSHSAEPRAFGVAVKCLLRYPQSCLCLPGPVHPVRRWQGSCSQVPTIHQGDLSPSPYFHLWRNQDPITVVLGNDPAGESILCIFFLSIFLFWFWHK